MKHSSDPRHIACKEEVFAYYRAKNGNEDPDWDGREGKALAMFLSANPKLTAVGIRKLLEARFGSEVNHSDRPSKWLPSLKSFLGGPIDRYGQLLIEGRTTNGKVSSASDPEREARLRAIAEQGIAHHQRHPA